MLISKYSGENILDKIGDLERKYNIILSKQYKDFLLKYNGGDTPKTSFSINKTKSDIRGFFGFIDKNKYLDINYVLDGGLGEELLVKFLLPIATNSFGDYVVINVSEENNGEVSFIYHDDFQKEVTIAANLKEFISKCKSEKIGHIRSIEERKQCLIDAGKGDKITQIKIDSWQKEIDKYLGICQEEVII